MSALQSYGPPRPNPWTTCSSPPPSWATSRASPRRGAPVRFNWVPQPHGVRWQRGGDEAARGATRHPAVALTVLLSIHGAKGLGPTRCRPVGPRATVSPAGAYIEAGSLAQTTHEQQRAVTPRPAAVPSRGGRSTPSSAWLLDLEELRDGFEERLCEHCPHMTPHPLTHYLLSCPATERLRQCVGPENAAALVRQFQKNLPLLLEVARAAPPPMNTKERE
ncbi:hypothetical protein GWK47_047012 [Chionoecetes opilio]|uniref:Uncharacterized protein n=1 Tax=Chionoecetes opilio TaxID=41210 RepID=A0A8J4YH00_CHIOP|nr:hypothetical protein GWK47_047012 [Chionoecetes opilio]